VLDVGCGSCYLKTILPKSVEYLGIDPFPVHDEILELTAEDILQVEIGQFETVCMFAALDNVHNLTEALTGLKYAATKNIVLLTGIGIEPDQYHTVRVDLEDITEVLGTPRIALELLPKVWLLEFEI